MTSANSATALLSDRLSPVAVQLSDNAVDISLGSRHSCALLQDGSAQCWGGNADGALGNGTLDPSMILTPAGVVDLTDGTQLALGEYHACVKLADRSLNCSGYNALGQLGDGTHMDRALPLQYPASPTWSRSAREASTPAFGSLTAR
jgi:alpha-tubulin suppressor-like RCC1 family protein